MSKKIFKSGLVIFLLVTAMTSPVAAQSLSDDASSPDELSTGLAILIVGILGILTVATVVLNSPVALLGLAGSFTFFLLALLGITSVRLFYIVGTIHALSLVASGVFKE
jgi:hypothetical protein